MKQVIVIRKDLNMRKGKMVAQGAHASMAAILIPKENPHIVVSKKSLLLDMIRPIQWIFRLIAIVFNKLAGHTEPTGLPESQEIAKWLASKFTKICCGVDSEDELLDVYEKAKALGLHCALIKDAGLTEFGGVPTYTAVAIGPGLPEVVDLVTGDLKLL